MKNVNDITENEVNKFHRVTSALDVANRNIKALGYPIAMKQSDTGGVKSWTSIIAEADFEEIKPLEQHVVLQLATTYDRENVLYHMLLLPANFYWKVLIILTIGFNYIWSTYAFCFEGRISYSKKRLHFELYFTDLVYLIDFIIALLHTYWKKLQKFMNVRKRRRLAFAVDWISLMPFEMLCTIFTKQYLQHSLIFWLRSLTFLRLYRVLMFFEEWENSAGSSRICLFIIKFLFLMIIFVHTTTCFWFSVGCVDNCTDILSWTMYVPRFSFNMTSPGRWYFISLYFSFMSITNCAIGSVMSTNYVERIICIMAVLIGFSLITGVYVGSWTSQMVNDGRRKAVFTNHFQAIKRHLTDIKMDSQSSNSVLKYYEILWVKRRGVKTAPEFELLPRPLQMEACFDINVGVFDKSLLFQNKAEPFLRQLSLLMKNVYHLPGEIICYQNVAKVFMMCIISGIVEILSDEDDESPMVSFTSGTILGEISLVMTVPSKATVRAATFTELQVLYKDDFIRMVTDYTYTHKRIRKEILTRIKIAQNSRTSESKTDIALGLFVSQSKKKKPIKIVKDSLYVSQGIKKYSIEITDIETKGNLRESKYLRLYRISKNISHTGMPNICLVNKFPFILAPQSQFLNFWRHFIFIIVIIVSFQYPHYIGFKKQFPKRHMVLNYVFDLIYVVDILITCITAIEKDGKVISNVLEIIYFRMETAGFFFDVISVFPIEIMSYLIGDLYLQKRVFDVLNLNRLLKAWKIPSHFRNLEENPWANVILLRICKYTLYMILISIWSSMLLYMTGCFDSVCHENTWYNILKEHELKMRQNDPCFFNPTVMAMYYAMNLLSGQGFGDIFPNKIIIITMCCLCILIGTMSFGFCIAEVSATCTQIEKKRVEYQEIVFAIKKFISENRLSKDIRNRVDLYFCVQWDYNKGLTITTNKYLLEDATWELQHKVLVKERIEILLNVPLFQDINLDFVQLIARNCKVLLLPANEIVIYAGSVGRAMYIIQEGFCEILNQKTGKAENIVGPNYHFGDIEMLYGIPRITTVRSVTHCKVIRIDYGNFFEVLSNFPSIKWENEETMREFDFISQIKHFHTHKMKTEINRNLIEKKKRINFFCLNIFKQHFRSSFIYVPKECHIREENYWSPFNSLQKFSFVKYLLMPWCILPFGGFMKCWGVLRVISALIVSVYEVYVIVTKSAVRTKWNPVLVVVNAIAYIDMYLALHFGYYNEKGILVIHPKCTAVHYIKHNFIVDFLGCFPFYSFINLCTTKHDILEEYRPHIVKSLDDTDLVIGQMHILFQFLRINRVLQIYRLFGAIHYMESNILRRLTMLRLVKFLPSTFVIINICTSVLLVLSCAVVSLEKQTASEKNSAEIIVCRKGSWISNSKFQNVTQPFDIYVITLYFVTCTFVNNGFNDINTETVYEMIILIVITIFGTLLFGYMFANICSSITNLHSTLSEYQEMMRELINFMEYESVEENLQHKLIKHFEYQWKRTSGIQPSDILSKLHGSLMEDALFEMYEHILKEVPLFENVDKSFYNVIGKQLKQAYFLHGTTIIRSQDVQQNIYIIFRGKVEVLSEYNEMIACMGPGGMFGNISSANATLCSVTIVASRNLDVLKISSLTLYNILNNYPDIKRKMNVIFSTAKDYVMPTVIIDDESLKSESTVDMSESDSKATSIDKTSSATFQSMKKFSSTQTTGTTNTLSKFHSLAIVILAKDFQGSIFSPNNWFKYAILPESRIYSIVSCIMLIVSYINCIMISYMFIFQDSHWIVFLLSMYSEVLFYTHILLEKHKAQLGHYGEYVIRKFKLSSCFSFKNCCYMEIFGNFPFWLFFLLFPSSQKFLAFTILRLNHLVRFSYVVNYYRSRSNLLMVNKLYLKSSIIFIYLTVIVHIVTCIWYFIGCPLRQCTPNSWADYAKLNNSTPAYEAYVVSLYYIASLFTTTGYGDILSQTILELSFTAFLMVTSKFLIALFIGDMTSVLDAYTRTLVNYEYSNKETADFLKNQHLSSYQMDKVWKYVKLLWKHGRGKQIPRFVMMAPSTLRIDLMNAIYGHHLRNCYIFINTNENFLCQLSAKLKHCNFFEGNYIVQRGDTDEQMYFIHRGEVSILTVHANLTETIHDVLMPGDMFGIVQGLYRGVPHQFSFRAKTIVSILILNLDNWYSMLKYFPEVEETIYSRANNIYTTF